MFGKKFKQCNVRIDYIFFFGERKNNILFACLFWAKKMLCPAR